MRRFLGVSAGLLLVALAAGMPAPPPPEEIDFQQVVSPVTDSASGGIWYCPWIDAGALSDTFLTVGNVPDVTAFISLPSPIANEVPDTAELLIPGPGAFAKDVAEIVRRGAAPGFVELSAGPGAVSTAVATDVSLAADTCVASVSKLWQLPGGTTRAGITTILRLYNPFPENAKLTISAISEFGNAPLPALRSIDVPGRSWRDFDLAVEVPFFDELALTVASDEGLIIPALVIRGDGGGEAAWPGTGLSTTWEFPVIDPGGLSPSLVVTNPGESDVIIEIDVFAEDGAIPAAETMTVNPDIPARIALDDYAGVGTAIRVRADGPVAAVVVAEDLLLTDSSQDEADDEQPPLRLAGTIGLQTQARRWLVVGPGSVPDSSGAVWLLNTSEQPVTVTMTHLTGSDREPRVEKIVVPPTSNLRVPVSGSGVAGHLVEATEAISAAWSLEAPWGVAMGAGVNIDG